MPDPLAVDDGAIDYDETDYVSARLHSAGVERPRVTRCHGGVYGAAGGTRHANARRVDMGDDTDGVALEVVVAGNKRPCEHGPDRELAAVACAGGDFNVGLGPRVV
jgi:hypothetical protein